MPTVTPLPPTTSFPPLAPASALGGVTPVEAGIGSAPDKIQQLAHQIQVSGLITQPPDGGEITLNTVIGNLTILLPLLAKDQQDKLLQQLTALFQSQKPLTVVIQPGNPPAQAFLLLPPPAAATNAAQTAVAQINIAMQTAAAPPVPLVPGVVLPAVVLPAAVLPVNTVLAPNVVQQNPLASPLLNPPISAPINPPTNSLAAPPMPSGALPPLSAEGLFAVLPDQLLLDELAVRAEAIASQTIPQAQAEIPAAPAAPASGFIAQANPAVASPQMPVTASPLQSLQPLQPPLSGLPVAPPVLSELAPPQAAAIAAPPLSSLLQPGMEISLRVDAVAMPGAPLPVASLPNQILATVTGSGPSGQVLVQAGDATLYVKQATDAPVGSTLLVTVEPGRMPVLTPLPLPDAGNFGALQQALATLAQADPQLARQIMESVIPQPNAALGGALLFILSAFRQGDVRSWLGNDAVDILTRAGKMELVTKLSQQLSEGGETVHDPVVGAWRSYTVPFHANNQFQTLQLYVHGDGRGRGNKDGAETRPGANAVRFLIDMRLSKLGALQLDGFVRPKQLDMIVRSEHMLPEGLNQDLRQSYIKSLEAVGYAGSLNFQIGRQHWLAIRKPASAVM